MKSILVASACLLSTSVAFAKVQTFSEAEVVSFTAKSAAFAKLAKAKGLVFAKGTASKLPVSSGAAGVIQAFRVDLTLSQQQLGPNGRVYGVPCFVSTNVFNRVSTTKLPTGARITSSALSEPVFGAVTCAMAAPARRL